MRRCFYLSVKMSAHVAAAVGVLGFALMSAGCNSASQRAGMPSAERLQANAAEMRRLDQLAAAGKISHVESVRRQKAIALEGATYSPEVEALWANELVIAERLDNKEITQIQADSLSAEATADLVRRNRPVSTNCNQTGATTNCTTY